MVVLPAEFWGRAWAAMLPWHHTVGLPPAREQQGVVTSNSEAIPVSPGTVSALPLSLPPLESSHCHGLTGLWH
jgi:hypothetical protein